LTETFDTSGGKNINAAEIRDNKEKESLAFSSEPVERHSHSAAVTVASLAITAPEVKVPLAAAERITRNAMTAHAERLSRVARDGVDVPPIHVTSVASLIFDLVLSWVVNRCVCVKRRILVGKFEAVVGT